MKMDSRWREVDRRAWEMNILPLTLLDSIVVIANTSDQRVPNHRALQSITTASCRSPYIMQHIECPLKWYLRVCTAVLYACRSCTSRGFLCARGFRRGFVDARLETRHVCARIRRCVHLDKLAALNLMSFISSDDEHRQTLPPWNVLHARENGFRRPSNRAKRSFRSSNDATFDL